ncbi:DnaJ domain-containing protein [Arthroderma uncinatum]|uniref:DnaJ domain-containing protein n=1 Tax=Arthroderma uncinatum TaxID=74035 RepID=UPI00144AECFC|nr:DnaJ domain-containing protein [Arthroderma uncinatum]KAF3491247.1 DnaJ domain-containing protein [Arthroderma uncinatum]
MVKPDVSRDYYADLGVGPNADQEEVKKQFRRLGEKATLLSPYLKKTDMSLFFICDYIAMKYHPDRNPGKESEYNSKFQAIQAAHEVLVDPQLRLKYDTGRLRAGYGKLYGPPRTATPSRQAPPQPTPNTTRKPQASYTTHQYAKPSNAYPGAYPPPPSSNAQKYASYAKAGAQKFDKVYEESRARAEAFQGFQDMKNKQPQPQMPGGWTNFDPRTGRSSTHEKPQTKPRPSHHQRGQSAYHAFAEEARRSAETPTPERSKSTKAKNGFAPRTAGGDEPMAKCATSYYNVRSDKHQAADPMSYFYEPAPSPTAKKQQGYDDMPDSATPNLQRTSSKYATAGGERTYMSKGGINRSTSVREETSRSRTNPPSPIIPTANPGRHHSASPKLKPNRQSTFSASSSSSTSSSDTDDTDEVIPNFRPKAVPRSRLAQNKPTWKPNFPDNKTSGTGESPFGWAMGPDSWLFAEIGGSPSQMPSSSKKWYGNADNNPQGYGPTTPRNNPFGNDAPFPSETRRESSIGRTIPPMPNVSSFRATSTEERRPSAATMYEPTPTPKPSARNWSEKWGFFQKSGSTAVPHLPTLWAYPANILPSTYTSPRITKEGDEEEEHAAFNTDDAGRMPRKSCPGNQDPSPSNPLRTRADYFTNTNSFNQPNNDNQPLPNEGMLHAKSKSKSYESFNSGFSPNEWNFAFSNTAQYFAPRTSGETAGASQNKYSNRPRSHSRPTTSQSTESPQKSSSPFRDFKENKPTQPSPFKNTTFSTEKLSDTLNDRTSWSIPTTDNSQQNVLFGQNQKVSKKRAAGPKPVSISSEAEEEDATFAPNEVHGDKPVPMGLVDEMDVDEELPTVNAQNPNPQGMNKPKFPVHQAFATSNKSGGKTELFSLKKLGLVNPFTSSNSKGIDDLKDLNSSLPFKSEASSDKPSQRPIHPRDLSLPKPPKPPTPPTIVGPPPTPRTAMEKASLPQAPWEVYMLQMQAYMREWNSFNRTMLAHFNERQNLVETALAPGWMRAMGDSSRVKLGDADDGGNVGDSKEDLLINGKGKAGYSEYLRGIEEDFVVRQHWDVAWERHRSCILDLGRVREWLRSGHGNGQGGFQPSGIKGPLN